MVSDEGKFADALTAAFLAGAEFGARRAIDSILGPRVKRPAGITDAQWVHWYGATRNSDGSFNASMSVAHLVPGHKKSRAAQ